MSWDAWSTSLTGMARGAWDPRKPRTSLSAFGTFKTRRSRDARWPSSPRASWVTFLSFHAWCSWKTPLSRGPRVTKRRVSWHSFLAIHSRRPRWAWGSERGGPPFTFDAWISHDTTKTRWTWNSRHSRFAPLTFLSNWTSHTRSPRGSWKPLQTWRSIKTWQTWFPRVGYITWNGVTFLPLHAVKASHSWAPGLSW